MVDVVPASRLCESRRAAAVLISGGDAPGMNGVVRAVARVGFSLGWEVLGVADGFQGLIAGRLHPLGDRGAGGILHGGGTILLCAH